MVAQNQEPMNIIAKSSTDQEQQHATTTPFCCCCCCCSNNTSMKRRSPSSSSATATEKDHIMRACKKLHLREQQGTINIPFHNYPDQEHANLVGNPSTDNKEPILTEDKEEQGPSNSTRLRRMKECLKEIRKCWDDVMREEGEELQEEQEDEPEGSAEGDNKSKDDYGGDAEEEAVKVEWAEKCLTLCFKCPCTKGYQILLSGNHCYYKLV